MNTNEVQTNRRMFRSEAPYHQKGFGSLMFELCGCAHGIDLSFKLKIRMDQWRLVAEHDDTFILFQA